MVNGDMRVMRFDHNGELETDNKLEIDNLRNTKGVEEVKKGRKQQQDAEE